jgi:hypothetical protein
LLDSGANTEGDPEVHGPIEIQMTLDVYRHLLLGGHDKVRKQVDVCLAGDNNV